MDLPLDRPVVPLITYTENNLPYLDNVIIPERMSPYYSKVLVELMNRFVSSAETGILRMFSFNHAVQNNWNNSSFIELLNLLLVYLDVESKKQQSSPMFLIRDSVNNFAAYYASSMPFKYSDILTRLSDSAVKACSSNFALYTNLKKELTNMNQQGQWVYEQHTGMYVNTATGQRVHPQQLQQTQQSMYSQQQQLYPQQTQQPYGAQSMSTPYPTQPNPYLTPAQNMQQPNPFMVMPQYPAQPMYPQVQRHQSVAPVTMTQSGHMYPGPVQENVDMMYAPETMHLPHQQQVEDFGNQFSDNLEFTLPAEPVALQAEEAPIESNADDEDDYLVIKGGSEMERSRHKIPFVKGIFINNSMDRQDSIFKKLKEDMVIRIDSEGNGVEPYSWIIMETLESAKDDSLRTLLDNQGTDGSIYRGFYKVPFLPHESIADAMDEAMRLLASSVSFTSLAGRLRSIIAELVTEESEVNRSSVDFLLSYNNMLTTIVNDFFKYNLSSQISIENFIEDIADIEPYLLKKGDLESLKMYKEFSEDYLSSITELLAVFENELSEEVTEEFTTSKTTKSSRDAMARKFSVTSIRASSYELGYDMEPNKPYVVDKVKAPSLYAILESLYSYQDKTDKCTEADYLMTTDKVTYRLLKGYDENRKHRIARV